MSEGAAPVPDVVLHDGSHITPTRTPLNTLAGIRFRSIGPVTASDPKVGDKAFREIKSLPYGVQIVSPYVALTDLTTEAVRTFTKPAFPSLEQLNAGLVRIAVAPDSAMAGDVIQSVVIKREGRVVQPLKPVIVPVTLSNAMGARKESAEGQFTFDYAVFAPTAPITLVLIGRAGNFEWTMPLEELSQLK